MRVIKTQINKNKPTFCEEEYADMDFWESFAMDVVQEEIGSKITIEIIYRYFLLVF